MKTITIRTSFEGTHCYPNAPEDVKFLREEHRHIFYIEATVEVLNNDREIEFILLKRDVNQWIGKHCDSKTKLWEMGTMSCESVATYLAGWLLKKYSSNKKRRYVRVSVFEDNENGATVEGCDINEL